MRFLFTGGAASGKSDAAEAAAVSLGGLPVYLACMQVFGKEDRRRVARHRDARAGKGFVTVERPRDLEHLDLARDLGRSSAADAVVLLECLGNLIANEMFSDDGRFLGADFAACRVLAGVSALEAQCAHLVLVGNDVGSSGEPYTPETQAYVECLGRVSCILAAGSDVVVESVCGVPNAVKGELPWVS